MLEALQEGMFTAAQTDMFDLAALALAGRGDSWWSGKGEKVAKRALEDGLSPKGALTAIILLDGSSLEIHGLGNAEHRCSRHVYVRRMPREAVQLSTQARQTMRSGLGGGRREAALGVVEWQVCLQGVKGCQIIRYFSCW